MAYFALYKDWMSGLTTAKHLNIAFDSVPGKFCPLQEDDQLSIRTPTMQPKVHIPKKLCAALAPSGFHNKCRHLRVDRYDALVWLFG